MAPVALAAIGSPAISGWRDGLGVFGLTPVGLPSVRLAPVAAAKGHERLAARLGEVTRAREEVGSRFRFLNLRHAPLGHVDEAAGAKVAEMPDQRFECPPRRVAHPGAEDPVARRDAFEDLGIGFIHGNQPISRTTGCPTPGEREQLVSELGPHPGAEPGEPGQCTARGRSARGQRAEGLVAEHGEGWYPHRARDAGSPLLE